MYSNSKTAKLEIFNHRLCDSIWGIERFVCVSVQKDKTSIYTLVMSHSMIRQWMMPGMDHYNEEKNLHLYYNLLTSMEREV